MTSQPPPTTKKVIIRPLFKFWQKNTFINQTNSMYSIVEILNVNKIMHVYQNLHSTYNFLIFNQITYM